MMDILKEEYQEITDGKGEARRHQKSMETASPLLSSQLSEKAGTGKEVREMRPI